MFVSRAACSGKAWRATGPVGVDFGTIKQPNLERIKQSQVKHSFCLRLLWCRIALAHPFSGFVLTATSLFLSIVHQGVVILFTALSSSLSLSCDKHIRLRVIWTFS
jgi:hypothetical protein